jgi:hypothetical protein
MLIAQVSEALGNRDGSVGDRKHTGRLFRLTPNVRVVGLFAVAGFGWREMSRLLAAVATVLMPGATSYAQAIPNSAGVRIFLVIRPQQAPLEGASQRGIDGFAHRMLRREARTTKRTRTI